MPLLDSVIGAVGGPILGAGLGLALQKQNDARQINQQQKLTDMQSNAQMALTDYNRQQQMKMWNDTNYQAQMGQIKKAGLNPALMYGSSGGGGQTTANVSTGNVTGGQAPSGGGEIQSMTGLGMQMAAQTALLAAQKENIEADTANKKAEAGYTTGVKTETTRQEGMVKQQQQWSMGLDNAIKEYLQKTDTKGQETQDYGSTMAAEGERQKLNLMGAENALKGKQWEEMAAKIDLMGKQGMTQEQITNNLEKDGTIKEAEIEWNKSGLTQGDMGKFIVALIHKLIK